MKSFIDMLETEAPEEVSHDKKMCYGKLNTSISFSRENYSRLKDFAKLDSSKDIKIRSILSML